MGSTAEGLTTFSDTSIKSRDWSKLGDYEPTLFIDRRIEHLKEKIRLRDVMTHFGHRYRLHGNMLCCWHSERNPSARFYDDQDTYWCWVCSPSYGVDQIEFVIVELGLEVDVDLDGGIRSRLSDRGLEPAKIDRKLRALAVIRAVEYLEDAFNTSYASTPWEQRLHKSLIRTIPKPDPGRYWRDQHVHILRLISQRPTLENWTAYSNAVLPLYKRRSAAIEDQRPLWQALRAAISRE